MRVLSLFSGAGLGDYGLELAGMEIVGQVEIEDCCQKLLKLRWPYIPKWNDIRNVNGNELIERCGNIDLISGGFPCQPFSVAGKRKGAADDRNLWPEMFRIVSEVRPTWVLAENVSGIIGYLESVVLPDLEGQGYETLPPLVFEAHALGAPHPRERVWIIAYDHSRRRQSEIVSIRQNGQEQTPPFSHGSCSTDADDNCQRFQKSSKRESNATGHIGSQLCGQPVANLVKLGRFGSISGRGKKTEWRAYAETTGRFPWCCQPGICRVVHGRSGGMDRLKMLGNGQVVPVVQWIGKKIMEFDGNQ